MLIAFLLIFIYSWARWTEILEQGQFKRGWREQDVEDCARVIVSFCFFVMELYIVCTNHSNDDCYANIEKTLGFR